MPKMNFHATGFVGEDRRVYEDGDQKNTPKKALEELNRTHFVNLAEAEHKDPKVRTQIYNRIIEQDRQEWLQSMGQRDPTLPAIMHGNKPSRGAEIDKELMEEEKAILAKKGDAMPGKKYKYKGKSKHKLEDQEEAEAAEAAEGL